VVAGGTAPEADGTRGVGNGAGSWATLALLAGAAAALLFASEWLFFATKPSFLSALPLRRKLQVLALSPLVPVCAAMALCASLFALSRLGGWTRRAAWRAALLLPAAPLALTLLLMATNFTNTLGGFGIASSRGISRGLWLGLLIALAVWSYRLGARVAGAVAGAFPPGALRGAAGAAAVLAFGPAAILFATRAPSFGMPAGAPRPDEGLPDILLVGGDGIDARHLSLRGYERRTTPNLDALLPEALVAARAFANADNTGASTVSILTGKLPTDNGVVSPADILRGPAAYQHLPGILRGLGYHTAQLTIRHYADAFDMNLRRGFDLANERSASWSDEVGEALEASLGSDAAFFVEQTGARVRDRVLHLLGLRDMADAYATVTARRRVRAGDLENLRALDALLAEGERPLFAHVHLLATHGPLFNPPRRTFSAGQQQTEPWMRDFYDDAILEFDAYLGRIVAALRARGRLDQTILVVYSDHGMRYETAAPVPLVIRFPGGRHRGVVRANAQGLDIAPTILDALHLPRPPWMAGSSLLAPVDPCRPIFGIRSADWRGPDGFWRAGATRIDSVTVVSCDRVFVATPSEFTAAAMTDHGGDCSACGLGAEEIRRRALALIAARAAAAPAPDSARAPVRAPAAGTFGVGVFRDGTFHLARAPGAANAGITIAGGRAGDHPIAGDWDGDGRTEVGLHRAGESTFVLFSAARVPGAPIPFGEPGDLPVVGDWDGDGKDSIGVYRPATGTFHLRNQPSSGADDVVIAFGPAGSLPVAGDWDGDGRATVGVFHPPTATFHLREAGSGGDLAVTYGGTGDLPLAGDWDGDGKCDLGVYQKALSAFLLTTRPQDGVPDLAFTFGLPGDRPVVGRW
jgi:hypothetical protein